MGVGAGSVKKALTGVLFPQLKDMIDLLVDEAFLGVKDGVVTLDIVLAVVSAYECCPADVEQAYR